MKEKEEIYTLTFKGLLSTTIKDERILKETLDSIELYLRRHHSKEGIPAIILDENKFIFASLKKE